MSRRKITSCLVGLTLLLGLAALAGGCRGDSEPELPATTRDDLDTVISGVRSAPPPEDPGRGGWAPEVFSAGAQDTLKLFAHLLDPPPVEAPPGSLLGKEFRCSPLRPYPVSYTNLRGHETGKRD